MSYVTLPQLAEVPGALELAQVASDKHQRPVAAELMDLTLRGGDRAAFPAGEIARADTAAARITQVIAEADAVIDGFLGKRYALPLPIASVPSLLTTWARRIVRYQLHSDRISDERTDPIARDYRETLKLLAQVGKGEFSLGIEDPTTGTAAPGDIQINTGHKVFGREFMP